MPTACMCAYMTVEPTKLNPRRLRSLLNASDSRDIAGISFIAFHRFTRGRPSTNRQHSLARAAVAKSARAPSRRLGGLGMRVISATSGRHRDAHAAQQLNACGDRVNERVLLLVMLV